MNLSQRPDCEPPCLTELQLTKGMVGGIPGGLIPNHLNNTERQVLPLAAASSHQAPRSIGTPQSLIFKKTGLIRSLTLLGSPQKHISPVIVS